MIQTIHRLMLSKALLLLLSSMPQLAQASPSLEEERTGQARCCEPMPQFAPPPEYKFKPSHPLRFRRKRRQGLSRRRPRPRSKVGLELGHSRIWVQPDSGQLSWDLSILHIWQEGRSRRDLWFGAALRVGYLEGVRWPRKLSQGDFWMNTRSWLVVNSTLGYRFWFFRAGFISYRSIQWGLPDATVRTIAAQLREGKATRNSLSGLGPNFVLPQVATGLRLEPLRLEAGAALHSWNFRSYRIHSAIAISKRGIGVRLLAAYQVDGVRMVLDHEDDNTNPNQLAEATWSRRFWEFSLATTFDLSTLLSWNKKRWIGPIQLILGVRNRIIIENHLSNTQDSILFKEQDGSQWAFFLGVRIAFGKAQNPNLS